MPQNPAIRICMAIALGAIPGALSRYLISEFSQATFGKDLAYYGTFFANFTGCFIIALFYTLNEEKFKNWPPEVRLIVATGFCGAYTTFSTYGLETAKMLEKGNITLALIYCLGSAILGMVGIQLGVTIANLNKAVER